MAATFSCAADAFANVDGFLFPTGGWKGKAIDSKQQRFERSIEYAAFSSRHGANRVAVITVLHDDDAVTGNAAIVKDAERHLDGYLDRDRSAVGIENVFQSFGREGDQSFGEGFGWFMGEFGEDDLVVVLCRVGDRPHNLRVSVAMGYNPPRRDSVKDTIAVLVE